jgi:sporulation protein YlmC with PRC-barrel domain
MKFRLMIPLLLVTVCLLAACGGDDGGDGGAASATPTAITQQEAPTPTEAATEPASEAVTDTEAVTESEAVTEAEETGATESMTGTADMTGTAEMTETEGVIDTGAGGELATPDAGTAITGTTGITGSDERTGTPDGTPGAITTDTGALTDTVTAAGQDAASVPGVLRASELLGFDVQNADGEDLGDIEDALIYLDQGCLDYMLLSFGGILGLGENQYLIPWRAVSLQPELQRVLLNIDPAVLNEAPVFDPNNLPDMTAADWDADLLTYWETVDIFDQAADGEAGAATGTMTDTAPMTGTEGMTAATGVMAQPCGDSAASATVGATETTTDTATSGEGQLNVEMPRVIRLSELLGYGVQNAEGEDLGAIEDIMVDWRREQLAYAILSFGGFLGLGEKWFVIPLDQLTLDPIEQRLVFDIEPERLENAPGFDADQLPDTTDPNWDQDIRDYWLENQ